MDENTQNSVVTPEEQNAEKEMTKEVTDEELRDKVVADYGLDPEKQKDLVDKLVADKKAYHEKLSGAIKQKINWRNKAVTSKPADDKGGSLKPEDVDKILDARLAERELSALPVSDEIKAEIKDLADLKHISIGEASKLPYIVSKIEEAKKEERLKNGTPKRTSTGGTVSVIDPSQPLNPTDFNLNTEEGRKEWQAAKEARAKWRRDNNQ